MRLLLTTLVALTISSAVEAADYRGFDFTLPGLTFGASLEGRFEGQDIDGDGYLSLNYYICTGDAGDNCDYEYLEGEDRGLLFFEFNPGSSGVIYFTQEYFRGTSLQLRYKLDGGVLGDDPEEEIGGGADFGFYIERFPEYSAVIAAESDSEGIVYSATSREYFDVTPTFVIVPTISTFSVFGPALLGVVAMAGLRRRGRGR